MRDTVESEQAEIRVGGKAFTLPVIEGTEGERAIDISRLREQGGVLTLDYGFRNTASCKSRISYLDGERGILRYRGYAINEIAEKSRFVEVAYLLVHGRLPSEAETAAFSRLLNAHSMIHEDMRYFFRNYPEHAHPMAILSAMAVSLSTFYPELTNTREELDIATTRLLSKMRTIAAFSYKKSIGEPFIYPRHDLKYCENFLNMMFSSPVQRYEVEPAIAKAMNVLLILHGDHEQNCSTSTVRLVGSAGVNLYAAVAAGICALWGPIHGGANQKVIEMLEQIHREGGKVDEWIERARRKESKSLLYGFGHAVYKKLDPRAAIVKRTCDDVLETVTHSDPLLDLAKQIEEKALQDDYFIERNLYPNVDFYSGIVYRAMGIPKNMFPVIFAIGRLPGWIAQWREAMDDPEFRLQRPRQVYIGPTARDYVPLEQRPSATSD